MEKKKCSSLEREHATTSRSSSEIKFEFIISLMSFIFFVGTRQTNGTCHVHLSNPFSSSQCCFCRWKFSWDSRSNEISSFEAHLGGKSRFASTTIFLFNLKRENKGEQHRKAILVMRKRQKLIKLSDKKNDKVRMKRHFKTSDRLSSKRVPTKETNKEIVVFEKHLSDNWPLAFTFFDTSISGFDKRRKKTVRESLKRFQIICINVTCRSFGKRSGTRRRNESKLKA